MNSAFLGLDVAAFLRVAAAIIFGERSIAVSRPSSSRSQTKVAATPWPTPDLEHAVAGRAIEPVDDPPRACRSRAGGYTTLVDPRRASRA